MEEFAKSMERHQRKFDERRTAEAISMGFSSKEELEAYEWECRARQHEDGRKRRAERAALEGKTVEELENELYSGNKDFVVGSPLPSLSQCRCEGMLHCLSAGLTNSKLF